MEATGTVIVGAGPAGLAVAACLQRAASPFIVLEQSAAGVGPAWRGRYQRLHLHTAKQHSGLPHLAFPRHHPRYPSREQVVEYLELYRQHFKIEPRFGQRVISIGRAAGGGWTTTTAAGLLGSSHVVLCTGRSDRPHRPQWPGQEGFAGDIVHSADYFNGDRFAGQRVLVVGLGNSGAEIAIDLVEEGARPDIAVRSRINVVPRDFLGMPIQRSTILLSLLPLAVRDRIGRLVSRLAFGDLRALGLPAADEGPVSQVVKRGRIPLIDVGTVDLVRAGKINLRPGVQGFGPDTVRFVDGTTERYDAVVLATGYQSGIAALLPDLPIAVDAAGCPNALHQSELPGLFFVGFGTPATGLLRQIAIDAQQVARQIVHSGS